MNFLDAYDITASNGVSEGQPEDSLNEEVSQVIGHIGRFWGGFRKQSQNVFQSARKDFGEVVTQAQKELSKLTSEVSSTSSTERTDSSEHERSTSEQSPDDPNSHRTLPTSILPQSETPAPISPPTLFSRLQLALPPNVIATVQNNIPETLKHASESIDLSQLRTTLQSEFQRVQGVTRAQAEEYVHKSEALLREAMKEAGEVLRDAVKVVPPEDGQHSSGSSSLIWDGTDMWTLPLDVPEADNSSGTAESSKRVSADGHRGVATRAESLFRRLKHDPSILRHDPEADPGLKELYHKWLSSKLDAKEGGILNAERPKISALLNDPRDSEALQRTLNSLVPSELTETVFWTRFFFRAHQIEIEEEKRKALIKGTIEEEDFSWEDDEEEATVLTPPLTDTAGKLSDLSFQINTSNSAGPRESSEEGYDVVSSGNASPRDGIIKDKTNGTDDPDSDWE